MRSSELVYKGSHAWEYSPEVRSDADRARAYRDSLRAVRPDWYKEAQLLLSESTSKACVGVNPEYFLRDAAFMAKDYCCSCPSQRICLIAGVWEISGTWGGVSRKKRRQLRVRIKRNPEAWEQEIDKALSNL